MKEYRDTHEELVDPLEELALHPVGSDLIFYPENPEDSMPERIVKVVEEWRARNGLPTEPIKRTLRIGSVLVKAPSNSNQ